MIDEARVWLFHTDQPAAVVVQLANVLDVIEAKQAADMAEDRERARAIVAHGVLRTIVGRQLGVPPESLVWSRGPHGKLMLAGPTTGRLFFSLSTCGTLAMVATSWGRAVGVDLERVPPDDAAVRIARRFYPTAEAAWVAAAADVPDCPAAKFATLWCRKEAWTKAFGRRLIDGLALDVRGTGPLTVAGPDGKDELACVIRDLVVPSAYRAAVALSGWAPFQVGVTRHMNFPSYRGGHNRQGEPDG